MQKTESGVTTTIVYEYNEDGLRTKKTATSTGVTEYILHGKNIVHMTQGEHELHFYYDAQDKPSIVIYDGTAYGYLYNLQGDVVAIVDGTGAKVVEYGYDAWGKPTSKTESLASTLGTVQPFRYRGYVFDEESGDYYLRSRYYRPDRGRFLNADCYINANVYGYCECSPISYNDNDGFTRRTTCSVCEENNSHRIRDDDHYHRLEDEIYSYETDDYPIEMIISQGGTDMVQTLNTGFTWQLHEGDRVFLRITQDSLNPVDALLVVGDHYAAPIKFDHHFRVLSNTQAIIVSEQDGPPGRVRVRTRPSLSADIITLLEKGTEVNYIATFRTSSGTDWHLVSGEFGIGFVHSKYCTICE